MTADLSIIVNAIEVLATLGVVWSLIRSQRILFAASPKPQVPQQDTGDEGEEDADRQRAGPRQLKAVGMRPPTSSPATRVTTGAAVSHPGCSRPQGQRQRTATAALSRPAEHAAPADASGRHPMVRPAFHGTVTASTIGEGNPSHLTERKNYVFKKRPGWPADPETRDDKGVIHPPKGGAKTRKAQRERMIDEFTVARLDGLSVKDAGERVGVTWKTARKYEEARLAAEQGTPS